MYMKHTLALVILCVALLLSSCNQANFLGRSGLPPTLPLQEGKTITKVFEAPEINPQNGQQTGNRIQVLAGTVVKYSIYDIGYTTTDPETGATRYIIKTSSMIQVQLPTGGTTWKLIEIPQPVIVD